MASIFVDVPPSEHVNIRAEGPNSMLIEFVYPCRPILVNVYLRQDQDMPYSNVYCHEVPVCTPHPICYDSAIAAAPYELVQAAYNPYLELVEVETAFQEGYETAQLVDNQPKNNERKKKKRKGNGRAKENKKPENIQEPVNQLTAATKSVVLNEQDKKENSESEEPSSTTDEDSKNESVVSSNDDACGSEESLNYYSLIIRNVVLENPYSRAPNELNKHCSQRLKEEIPMLKSVSARCIVMECFGNGPYYGTLKLDVSKEEVRDQIASLKHVAIGGRKCPVQKNASRINAFRCFRCQIYRSHDTRSCKEPREFCLKCSENHRFKDCPVRDHSYFRCINCVRVGHEKVSHMAGTFYCPIELKQRKLAAKATKRNQDLKEQEHVSKNEELSEQDPKQQVVPEMSNKPTLQKERTSTEKKKSKEIKNVRKFFV